MPFCFPTTAAKEEESLIFSFKKTNSSGKTIAVCGLDHGCGTTCISLALSNYLCNKQRKKTAYIELNATGQISSLSKKSDKTNFSYMGIDFYSHVTLTRLSEILQKKYDYFVLDIGILNPNTAYEFSRCNRQFIVTDLSIWKRERTLEKLEQLCNTITLNQERVVLLGNSIMKESVHSNTFKFFSKVISIPFIPNPFQIASYDFMFYESLIERN